MSHPKPVFDPDALVTESIAHLTIDDQENPVAKKQYKRRSPRQKLLIKMKAAAAEGDTSCVLKYYLELCILAINDSKTFAEKMTPRTIIEVCDAINAIEKMKLGSGTAAVDPEMAAYMERLREIDPDNIKKRL